MYELVIDEEEASLVKEICHLYRVELWGTTKIAKHMNTFSTTKEGGKWDNKAIRNILFNPTIAGFNHFKPDGWPEDQRIIKPGTHPGIITKEELQEQLQIRDRRKAGQMSKRTFEYPYSGIIKCGLCGATYAGNGTVKNGKTYRTYRCLNQYAKGTCSAPGLSETKLNQIVMERVEVLEDGWQRPKKSTKPKVNMQKELDVSQKRKRNWMMALGDGKLSGDDYAALVDEEDARIRALQKQIPDDPEPTIPLEQLRQIVLELKTNWPLLDVNTQKQIIQATFKKITINKEEDGWHIVDMLTV